MLQDSYDAAGRISGLRFGEHDLARDIRYLPFGPVTGMRLGGVNLSRSYDQRYQASRIQAGSLDYVYTRNAAGQVTESKGLAVPAVESGSESYSIDGASNQLTVRAGKNYSYDAAGRLLSDGLQSFGWDALGRLKTVRRNGQELAGYGYDSQNRRVRKIVGAKTTYYLYDLENRLIAEIAGNGRVLREYVWLGQEPVALREYELRPGLYYYINDHLGTPQRLITGEGTVVWQAAALPFGSTQVQLGTVQNNLRFPGQYFDVETELHYNWNRFYDPETGRYLSPDPIGLGGGSNLYAYAENDPVNWIDPNGLSVLKIISLCEKGYKVIKTVGWKEAVKAVRKGENVLSGSHAEAKRLARAASSKKKPIRDPAHKPEEGQMPHYHPNPRNGSHVFYQIAAGATASHYLQCDDPEKLCTEAVLG